MIRNSKIAEINKKCNVFIVNLKHDNDTSDEFGAYTAQLNSEELKYCGAVFEILESYHFGKISLEESKKLYNKLLIEQGVKK